MRTADIIRDIFDSQQAWFPVLSDVISFDAALQTADIQPLVKVAGQQAPPVKGALVLLPGGGGWSINLHLTKGDTVLAIFCGTQVALWRNGSNEEREQEAPQLHNAVIIGVVARVAGNTAGTSPGVTIKNQTGTISLEMTDDKIKILGDVEVTGELVATTMKAGVTPAEVALLTHTHSGVTTGTGSTGAPNPGT